MNKLLLTVTGDYNDADYNDRDTYIKQEELDKLKPILDKMSKQPKLKGYFRDWREKYPTLTEDELDYFEEYVPYGHEDCGIHTIISVVLREVISEKVLWKR